MGWITRALCSCIPLGRQSRLSPTEESLRSSTSFVLEWDFTLSDEDMDDMALSDEESVRSSTSFVLEWDFTLSDEDIDDIALSDEESVRSSTSFVLEWDFTLNDEDIDDIALTDEDIYDIALSDIDIHELVQRAWDESLVVQERGLSEETISASLETRRIHIQSLTSEDRNEETEICTICQAEYESGEKVATLNCNHEYHVKCIKKWLRRKNACPICKGTAVL